MFFKKIHKRMKIILLGIIFCFLLIIIKVFYAFSQKECAFSDFFKHFLLRVYFFLMKFVNISVFVLVIKHLELFMQ